MHLDILTQSLLLEIDCRGDHVLEKYLEVEKLSALIEKRICTVQTSENLMKRPFVFRQQRYDDYDSDGKPSCLQDLKE